MNKQESELFSLRTSIEGYKNILKNDDLSDEKREEICKRIIDLENERDKLLSFMMDE